MLRSCAHIFVHDPQRIKYQERNVTIISRHHHSLFFFFVFKQRTFTTLGNSNLALQRKERWYLMKFLMTGHSVKCATWHEKRRVKIKTASIYFTLWIITTEKKRTCLRSLPNNETTMGNNERRYNCEIAIKTRKRENVSIVSETWPEFHVSQTISLVKLISKRYKVTV